VTVTPTANTIHNAINDCNVNPAMNAMIPVPISNVCTNSVASACPA